MAYTYLGLFLSQSSRMSDTAIGLTLAAYGVAGIAGTFGGERLAVRDVRRSFVMVVVLLACAIAGITLAGQHAGASAVLISLWGLAFGAVPVCLQLWLFRAAPEQAEASSAFVVTVFQLALAAGAYGGGWLVDHAGLRIAYAGGALVALLALVPLAMAGQGGARQG
jgi:predicted MFS family arabinose efflux permease